MEGVSHFSESYEQAREKFLAASEAAGASVAAYENPVEDGDPVRLYMDVAVLGRTGSSTALALGSGTHGVEGFCGSGIQVGLLKEGFLRHASSAHRVVLVHAINPYGFARIRRANEDNVDLNRNFIDHSKPHPENRDYDKLARALAPAASWLLRSGASLARLRLYQLVHGKEALQAAVTRGQYRHPKGLFYGGVSDTWSNRTFRRIVREHLSGAERVAFIDFHTGLGPNGYGELISNYLLGSPEHDRAVEWWGDRVKTTKAGESVSADLTGAIKLCLFDELPEAEVTAATLEFGTVPPLRVLRALQAENWLHHFGGHGRARAARIKTELRRVFYPDTEAWKARVWEQGAEVVAAALSGLASK